MSDDVRGYPGAPPGWYADPAGGPGQRWWDGYSWTEATVVPAAPAPPSSYISPPPNYPKPQPWVPGARDVQGVVGDELRISRFGRVAIAFPGLAGVINVIGWDASASRWRNFGHQFHLSMQAGQSNRALPPVPDSLGAFSSILVLCAIAAVVVECVWQFRAATAARSLGLPARRSPGWGVAFWFIPVVNFWMPYQGIRDCLSPGDPSRAVVLRYWLLLVGTEIGSTVTLLILMTSTPVGVAFSLFTAVCALGVLATAPKVVTAIAVAHHAALTP